MNKRIPRVCAVHDLSCFGRCALTVVLPTLSVMGVQTVPLPTALLSTHTGGFEGMSFLDLDGEMLDISRHFDRLGIEFDAIYTGFLGSAAQIETVSRLIDRFGSVGCTVFVDPVMGDDGTLYSTYTDKLMHGMKRLCKKADIITPNLTEACFLTGVPYRETDALSENDARAFAQTLCEKLRELFSADIALTGIHYENGMIATCGLTNGFFFHGRKRVGRNYPGTGDLFASVMLGRLLGGAEFPAAAGYASDFIGRVIEYSEESGEPARDGVVFEPLLSELRK